MVKLIIATIGENMKVTRFVRFNLRERGFAKENRLRMKLVQCSFAHYKISIIMLK